MGAQRQNKVSSTEKLQVITNFKLFIGMIWTVLKLI